MKEKLIMLLAFDAMLQQLDNGYEKVPNEVFTTVEGKLFEIYGLKLSSSMEDAIEIKNLLIHDVRNIRDNLMSEF